MKIFYDSKNNKFVLLWERYIDKLFKRFNMYKVKLVSYLYVVGYFKLSF